MFYDFDDPSCILIFIFLSFIRATITFIIFFIKKNLYASLFKWPMYSFLQLWFSFSYRFLLLFYSEENFQYFFKDRLSIATWFSFHLFEKFFLSPSILNDDLAG